MCAAHEVVGVIMIGYPNHVTAWMLILLVRKRHMAWCVCIQTNRDWGEVVPSGVEKKDYSVCFIAHTGSTCLHVPAGYAGISRWRHNMPTVVCRAVVLFVCRAFSPAWCHFQHLSVVPGALLRRAKMHPDPDRDNFLLITRYYFILCKELITPNSYLCIYNKNVAGLSGIVARLTATTAILSRICR